MYIYQPLCSRKGNKTESGQSGMKESNGETESGHLIQIHAWVSSFSFPWANELAVLNMDATNLGYGGSMGFKDSGPLNALREQSLSHLP